MTTTPRRPPTVSATRRAELSKRCLDKCFLHPQQLCLVEDELTHGTHYADVGAQTVVCNSHTESRHLMLGVTARKMMV